MEKIILNKKQKKEMKRITTFFMECIEPISSSDEKYLVESKISSHLGCFTERLVGHLNNNQKWEKI